MWFLWSRQSTYIIFGTIAKTFWDDILYPCIYTCEVYSRCPFAQLYFYSSDLTTTIRAAQHAGIISLLILQHLTAYMTVIPFIMTALEAEGRSGGFTDHFVELAITSH